jgi:hypothetical protein
VRSSRGSPAKSRISDRRGRERNGKQPDLGFSSWVDPGAEACGEELGSEAGAEEGNAGLNRLGDDRLLVDEPGILGLVVHAHRAAHGDDHVELSPIGKGLALVELDAMDRRSALAQDVLVDAGGLAGDVLEDEGSHFPHSLCGVIRGV